MEEEFSKEVLMELWLPEKAVYPVAMTSFGYQVPCQPHFPSETSICGFGMLRLFLLLLFLDRTLLFNPVWT